MSTVEQLDQLSQTGARMDRQLTGHTTIGGRGANRSFHGKIASMVITTLKQDDDMPSTAEITKMVTDPQGLASGLQSWSNIPSLFQSG